jgi:hypothetical protein
MAFRRGRKTAPRTRWGDDFGFGPYVSSAERQQRARRAAAALRKAGREAWPVTIEGRAIASTFWGKAWCENLERYSDYVNRLPRGRSYLRQGAVVDLQVTKGEVTALVSGTALYTVAIRITPVAPTIWQDICRRCAGEIGSVVELLQGRLSDPVMEHLCRQETGLFPTPRELRFSCSCPDAASMCKHVAATLYGVGARLDEKPELLFRLRAVDEQELIARAASGMPLAAKAPPAGRLLDAGLLEELFGVEIEPPPQAGRKSGYRRGRKRVTPRCD